MARKPWSLAVAALLAVATAAHAQTEVREFVIQVGNKTAGQYQLTIARQADGTEVAASAANVQVKHLIGSYSYSIQASEVWKDYRLKELKSSGNDNGKHF